MEVGERGKRKREEKEEKKSEEPKIDRGLNDAPNRPVIRGSTPLHSRTRIGMLVLAAANAAYCLFTNSLWIGNIVTFDIKRASYLGCWTTIPEFVHTKNANKTHDCVPRNDAWCLSKFRGE